MDDLRAWGMPVYLQQISPHRNLIGKEVADIAAKKATGQRRAKRRNGKRKKWDCGHTAEKHEVGWARVEIKLASQQKTLER